MMPIISKFVKVYCIPTHNEPAVSPNYTNMTMTQYEYKNAM